MYIPVWHLIVKATVKEMLGSRIDGVLDGPRHVSYTLIIHYMVIFLTVFEILDSFRDQILLSEAVLGVPGPPGQTPTGI